MKMEYQVEILRGWPYDGSLDRVEAIKSGANLKNGDWVVKQADGSVDLAGSTAVSFAGVVLQGNVDSASAVNTGKATVLWSNFIAKVANFDAGQTYAPGVPVVAKNGVITLGTAGQPCIGHVLDVVASGSSETAHLTIVV